ncbi:MULTISPECIES: hypothetical protein [unclassified Microbacterium]|nr:MULTISPECIES: hypothetical protein [unclassified Microbacterium]
MRLRGYRDLTHDREIELTQLQKREQELRRTIVNILDDRGAVEVNA